MKKINVLFVLFVSIFILAACGNDSGEVNNDHIDEDSVWAAIEEEGVLVVGTSGTLYPASYYAEDSDELTGYDVEVIRKVAEELGVEVQFEEMGFDAMLASLDTGRVDVIQAGPREESREKFAFSNPFKYSYSTMIVRSDDLSGIETLEDLAGKKAGGAATTVYSEIAEKYGAEVITYANPTNDVYLRDVHNGRTDVIINDYYLQKLSLDFFTEFNIQLHPDLQFHPTTNNVVMSKEAPVLMQKVNEALDKLREDGVLAEISGEFFGGEDVSIEPEIDIIEIEGIE